MSRIALLLSCFFAFDLQAQTSFNISRTLEWGEKALEHRFSDGETALFWQFKGCSFANDAPTLAVWSERFPVDRRVSVSVEILAAEYEPVNIQGSQEEMTAINATVIPSATLEQERNRFFARVRLLPYRRSANGFERLKSFSLRVTTTPLPSTGVEDRGGPFTYTSALSSGNLYKFGVAQTGIYKLDYNFLKNDLKISDLDNIDPRSIRLFGNGGYLIPERNSDPRPDDLTENAIRIVGEEDGKFNTSDYILFYAVGPRALYYRSSSTDPELTTRVHLYDNNAWYFIKTGEGSGALRLAEQASVPASAVTETFDDFRRIEEEKINLLDVAESALGSGKRWFGDYFYQTRSREYEFDFPNLVPGSTARVRAEFAGRSATTSVVRLVPGNAAPVTRSIGGVTISNNESTYALDAVLATAFQPENSKFKVKIDYPETSQQSEGWLDYIEVNARRQLTMNGQTMEFRDAGTLAQEATTFRLSGVSTGLNIWDITNPLVPRNQSKTQNGGTVEFGATTQDQLRSFIAFYDNATFPKPEKTVGKIANQNLHGIAKTQMVIVYHPDLLEPAKQLAEHRRTFSGLDVALVNVLDIYNEFSSGAKDIGAIRDFSRMLLERAPNDFKYLLLFGDGSFDPKNNTNSADNIDLVPVFETSQSFNPIQAFPSDDFFGLLSPDERGDLVGALDIAVGRITARNAGEAQAVVDKIIEYESNPATLGDWRLRALYIADDEDGNPHIDQADKLGNEQVAAERWFNIEKIYFDAYQQVATSGGQRFPDAKAAINANVFKGALLMQYIGHGGPRGWAQERVVDQNDISGWDNPGRYPLIITATCSFGGYDDYTNLTGGEQSLVKVKSGAIGLFTTVRAVYISGNEQLTDAVQGLLFRRINGQYLSIGDVLARAKNTLGASNDNARRFTLLGDPAMYLDFPDYRVATTAIKNSNGQAVDTLKALMPLSIEGMVTDTLGKRIDNFNGKVFVTIFDKAQSLRTLGQDQGSLPRNFTVQRNAIFRGSASVRNGTFKIDLVVPKDIDYKFGIGKISYYAENGTPFDAAGADETIVIGGNANQVNDDTPPVITPFLNTDAFAFGGITDNDPKILVKCSDDFGMNVSGTSLGHDLTAILDGNVLETIVLNDFYQSEQDSSKKGSALYPLRDLTPGKHTLKVKGWDIANNPGEGYTEFVVSEDGKAALEHVLNYPNPFTTNTYFQFEHNLPGQLLDVQVDVFTVSGKIVKTIQQTVQADGYRMSDEIQWNGKDEYGDQLARGVYVYKVKVRGRDVEGQALTAESSFEKLVILK